MPKGFRVAKLSLFLLTFGIAAQAAATTIWVGAFGGLYRWGFRRSRTLNPG